MNDRQRGFTLVELMVAAAIALLVLGVVTLAYVGGLKTQTAQADDSRLNESGRFSFDLVARELRQSGFANNWQNLVTIGEPFCSAVGKGQLLGENDPATIDPASATLSGSTTTIYSPGGTSSSDVLRVRYYGEDTTGTSPIYDCQGNTVATGLLVEDTLYVAADANNNNEPTLYCHTNNPVATNASLPMVAGVESLQLLYGEDTDSDRIVNRYVPWQLVSSVDNILSIKVSTVVRGPTAGAAIAAGATGPWFHFSSDYPAATNDDNSAVFPAPGTPIPSDNRLRKLLSTEISFRNYRWCS